MHIKESEQQGIKTLQDEFRALQKKSLLLIYLFTHLTPKYVKPLVGVYNYFGHYNSQLKQ